MTLLILLMGITIGVLGGTLYRMGKEIGLLTARIVDQNELAERNRTAMFGLIDENTTLQRENIALHEMNRAHEFNLEMVLAEMGRQA